MIDKYHVPSVPKSEALQIELKTQDAQLRSVLEEFQSYGDKYRELYDSAPVGYLTLDKNKVILGTNLTFTKMLGYDKQSLIGTNFIRYVSTDSRHTFRQKIRKALSSGICKNCFVRMLKNNGSQFYAGLEASILYDKESKPSLLRVVVVDISGYKHIEANLAGAKKELGSQVKRRTLELEETNRKITEELQKHRETEDYLKESNEFNIALLETAPFPIVVTNLDTSVRYVNPAFESLTGFTRAELVGWKTPFPWWPPDMMEQYDAENMPGRRIALNRLERRYQKKNGEPIWISLYIRPVEVMGEIKYFLANWVDITERKKSEEQIKQSTQRIEKLFQLMTEGAILWDSKLHIIQLNSEAERIFGMQRKDLETQPYRVSEWPVKPPWERIRPDGTLMPEEELASFQAKRNKCEIRNIEFGHKWPDGTVIWMNASAVPIIDPSGNIDCILCTFTDITEQRQLRDDREYYLSRIMDIQEEERKHISRELHDDTAQYLSLLTLELDALAAQEEKLPPDIINTLKRLHGTAEQAVQKVRHFSHELHPGVLETFGLISALEILIGEFNEQGNIKVKFVTKGEEKRLSGEDELAFFRIAQESLNNLRKHSRATQARVVIEYLRGKVRLIIADNGKGFEPEKLSHSTAKTGGLGLISMRERATLIGANLRITSRPDMGTIVIVELKY